MTLDGVPSGVLLDLKRRYAEPHRAYHTWRHIEEMLGFYAMISAAFSDPAAVLWAILFHDAVYDPTRSDNEQKSAELLAADQPALGDRRRSIDFAISLVRATAKHAIPDDLGRDQAADAAMFLDMDLSILAADPERFDEYEVQVRQEYAFVPDAAFAAGRGRILRGFLQRPALYLSPWGQARFETKARSNLERSLAALDQSPSP